MDPLSLMLGGAGALGVEATREFVKRIAGKLGDDVGELAREFATFRVRRLAETLRRAHELVEASANAPHPIPPRTLIPLLNGASLEDDAELSERWAALLASAATSDDVDDVPPSFATILAQLSPLDAHVLAALGRTVPLQHGRPHDPTFDGRVASGAVTADELTRRISDTTRPRVDRGVDVLVSHGLATRHPIAVAGNTLASLGAIVHAGAEIRISELGRAFLRACDGPQPR